MMMRITVFLAMAIVAGAVVVQPATRRSHELANPHGPPGPEVKWSDVKEFFEANSPHRWADYEAMSDLKRRELRSWWIRSYTRLQMLKRQGEELYALRKQQIKLMDDLFQIRHDLHKPGADAEKVKRELRGKITDLVNLGIEERLKLIQKLESDLVREKADLDRDQQQTDKLIESMMEQQLNAPMGEWYPRRPDRGDRERERPGASR